MDATERALLVETLERITETAGGEPLDGALAELGWVDALRADPTAAIAVLFAAQGAAHATSAALDQVLGLALGGANGPAPTAVVLPVLGTSDLPGRHREDGGVTVRGLGTAALRRAATAVVAVAGQEEGAGRCRLLALDVAWLDLHPVDGIDPALGLVEVSGDVPAETAAAADDGRELTADAWEHALALGRLALGCELTGAGRTMLELARSHALERVQFGRPIASFQAVRHRLAESLVALEAADALLAAAEDDPVPTTAAMAKALAGRSARTVARHAQQVLAGIGFTTEHPLHLYVRRVLVLDELLGNGDTLTRALGAETLARRALPATLPL